MERVRTPLYVTAVYNILFGLIGLSPALIRSVFGYELKDPGAALTAAGFALGLGIVTWMIAANTGQYGRLANAILLTIAVAIIIALWGWARGLFTTRNVIGPLVIDVVLAGWIWSARPRS